LGLVTAGAIGRVSFLGDDPLEPDLADLLEKRLALAVDVLEHTHGAELGHRLREQLLPRRQWERTEIEIVDRQQVERVERCRQLDRRPPHVDVVR
jgi:hypothetical protein